MSSKKMVLFGPWCGEFSYEYGWWVPEIRNKRNQLLQETDVHALSDRNITDAMKKYRQDLRDLPASNADPSKIVFPTKPK